MSRWYFSRCLLAFYVALLILAGTTSCRAAGAAYFESPRQAVEQITPLLLRQDWPALARYYDLKGTHIQPAELESGGFFANTEQSRTVDTRAFPFWKQPFYPGSEYKSERTGDQADVVAVTVSIFREFGGGLRMADEREFLMRKSSKGYQLLPPRPVIAARVITTELASPGLHINENIELRNTGPTAIVLRGVKWAGYRDDITGWRRSLVGGIIDNQDGTITYHSLVQSLTFSPFELGLLLPGEALTVAVPLTPQSLQTPPLEVTYAPAGKDVLAPKDKKNAVQVLFVPADEALRKSRNGLGSEGYVKNPGAAVSETIPVNIPMALETDVTRTGGITMADAAVRAGLPVNEGYWGTWNEPLKSWFLMGPDGKWKAVRWELPPTAPPDTFKWKVYVLPVMDVTVADDFGTGEGGKTSMLLNPDLFGDLVKVELPSTNMVYNPGATILTKSELWKVLDRAEQYRLPVNLQVINPNGLGAGRVLAIGVKTDSSGRWTSPRVKEGSETLEATGN